MPGRARSLAGLEGLRLIDCLLACHVPVAVTLHSARTPLALRRCTALPAGLL